MVLHAKIAIEVFKQGTKLLRSYYRIEGKAFNRLYTGFPSSKTIGRGVRHGLTGGSVIGSLLTDAEDSPGNGAQKPFSPKAKPTQTYKPYKTRVRQPTSRYCRNPNQF